MHTFSKMSSILRHSLY